MAISVDDEATVADGEWAARLDGFVDRARTAAAAMRRLDQEAVDRIVWAMTVAGLEHAVDLAELAMEETQFGVFEDKVLKNYIATEFLYDYLKDKRSVGVIDEDRERAIQYVAEPIGVVLALLPITNLGAMGSPPRSSPRRWSPACLTSWRASAPNGGSRSGSPMTSATRA